ncbi:MAG: hypothetical protein WB245_09505 [Acidimicrobiia bacterium]
MKRTALFSCLALTLVVSACSASGETTTTQPGTTSTIAPATTTTESQAETTTTVMAETTTTAPEVDVTFANGVVDGPDQFEYKLGDEVSIIVVSDVAEEVHVHGYDLMFDVMPDIPVEITLTADVTGIFEVEMEDSGTPLFDLVVNP